MQYFRKFTKELKATMNFPKKEYFSIDHNNSINIKTVNVTPHFYTIILLILNHNQNSLKEVEALNFNLSSDKEKSLKLKFLKDFISI